LSGSGKSSGVAIGGGNRADDALAGFDEAAIHVDVLERNAARADMQDAGKPQQLLDRRRHQFRLAFDERQLIGMLQHRQDAQRRHVLRGLMTRAQEQPDDVDQRQPVDVTGLELLGNKPGYDIVLRLRFLSRDQRVQIGEQIVQRFSDLSRCRFRAELDSCRLVEKFMILIGDAEQECYDLGRQWPREVLDQIGALREAGVGRDQPIDRFLN